jgi:hypothetical protein
MDAMDIDLLWRSYTRYRAMWAGQYQGQRVSRILTAANALPLANGAVLDIGSVDLPAGDWDLMAEVWIAVTSGTPNIQLIAAAISNVGATIPTDPSLLTAVNMQEPQQPRTGSGTGAVVPVVGPYLSLATPTTYYLCAQVSWTGTGSLTGYGKVEGRYTPAGSS